MTAECGFSPADGGFRSSIRILLRSRAMVKSSAGQPESERGVVSLIGDEQLCAGLDAATAVSAMRRAMADAERGTLIAPPRVAADLGPGRVVFSAGARAGDWFGYRS